MKFEHSMRFFFMSHRVTVMENLYDGLNSTALILILIFVHVTVTGFN